MSYFSNIKEELMHNCAEFIMAKYQNDGYLVQKIPFEEQGKSGILVQVKNTEDDLKGYAKTAIGCKTCVSLKLLRNGQDLNVTVKATSWLDKGLVMVAAWVFLWPLLATGGFGIYRQKQLIDSIQQDVTDYFANTGR